MRSRGDSLGPPGMSHGLEKRSPACDQAGLHGPLGDPQRDGGVAVRETVQDDRVDHPLMLRLELGQAPRQFPEIEGALVGFSEPDEGRPMDTGVRFFPRTWFKSFPSVSVWSIPGRCL